MQLQRVHCYWCVCVSVCVYVCVLCVCMCACVFLCVCTGEKGRERCRDIKKWPSLCFLPALEPPSCLLHVFPLVFQHIPLLAVRDRSIPQLAEEYKVTKQRRPVCGGIVLNTQLDKVGGDIMLPLLLREFLSRFCYPCIYTVLVSPRLLN